MKLPVPSETQRLIALSTPSAGASSAISLAHPLVPASVRPETVARGERYRTYLPFLIILPIIPAVLFSSTLILA
jgi:hypothetical protein